MGSTAPVSVVPATETTARVHHSLAIIAYTRWVSICAQAPLYRQREFHQSPLWRILVDHGEEFLRSYDSRYEETHGPLPLQSARVMEKLLRCGDPRYGLTLLHCPDCQVHMAVPFSCKTRVCPSCINRRAEVLSHTLAEKLPEGDYRHPRGDLV